MKRNKLNTTTGELTKTIDLSQLSAPEVGRFRTDIGELHQKTRRMEWLLKCGAEEINLDEIAEVADQVEALNDRVRTFARRRAS